MSSMSSLMQTQYFYELHGCTVVCGQDYCAWRVKNALPEVEILLGNLHDSGTSILLHHKGVVEAVHVIFGSPNGTSSVLF